MKALAAGILLIICALFMSCSGGNRTTTPVPPDPRPSITLTVNVVNLPSGAAANVTLTNPNGQAVKVSSTQTLSAITGTYSVAAAPVVYGNSTYHATETVQEVSVSGASATVTVDYYNVIPNTTKVLDQAGMQSLALSAEGVLTISSSSTVAASLQPGDVLVSAPITDVAPHGLLRKIVSVTSSGATITANTTAATLADEITRAQMSSTFTVSPSASARKYAQRRALSTAATTNSLSNPCAGNASTLSIPIDASLPPDALGHTLNASGELDVCSFKVTFNFDAKAPSATLSISAQQFSNILVQGQYSGSFDQRINLDPVELEDRVICLGNETCEAVSGLPQSIGNALAVIKPTATFFVGMSGTGAGGIYTGGTESGQLEAGLRVQLDTVTPIASSTLQATSYPTALDLNADVKGYFGAAFGIQVFGSVTGHVDPDAFIELTANTNNNPWWTLKSGLEASAGLRTSVLGFFAHDYDTSRFELWSTGIASASGPYSGLPTLLGIAPNSAPVNSTSLTLALSGSNFVPGAIVTFNGAPLSTTYKDPTSLTAVLSSYYLNTPGTFPVLVSNPNGSGSSSSSLPFSVIDTGLGNVTVSPDSVSLVKGGTQTFTATVSGGGNVTWSVAEGSSGGTITNFGLYTAPQTNGTFHVKATNVLDSSKNATAVVTVNDASSTPTQFVQGPTLHYARGYPNALLLNTGKVLIVGVDRRVMCDVARTAELYDPALNAFSDIVPMSIPRRSRHALTMLSDGRVLVTGGDTDSLMNCPTQSDENLAEVFNPVSGTFSKTQNGIGLRAGHIAVLLNDNTVLVAGGELGGGASGYPSNAFIYNPTTNQFSQVGNMTMYRQDAAAVLLPSGKVLIAGGSCGNCAIENNTTEIYDPVTRQFTSGPLMNHLHHGHSIKRLPDGRFLIVGGYSATAKTLVPNPYPEIFDPSTMTFSLATSDPSPRTGNAITTLANGDIAQVGGGFSSEVYQVGTGSFRNGLSTLIERFYPAAVTLQDGRVLVLGGFDRNIDYPGYSSTEIGIP